MFHKLFDAFNVVWSTFSKGKTNKNSVLILTTDSDFYQYIKQAIPGEAQSLSAPVSRGTTPYAGNVGR
jgi:hypothetical protein